MRLLFSVWYTFAMGDWSNFCIVIAAQFLFLLIVAYKKRGLKSVTKRLLLQSMALGVLFGISFDLLVGKYFGVFDYRLGFQPVFLVVNGALSYGLMIATVSLLRAERLARLYGWVVALAVIYELVNHYYSVWRWTFVGNYWLAEAVAVVVLYFGLAILLGTTLTLTTGVHFHCFHKRRATRARVE